jgi:AsmA protein
MGTGSVLGAASIRGTVDWFGAMISFSDAEIELDGNSAKGALSARFTGGRPAVQGALAFGKLDLSPYVEAMRAELTADGPWLIAPTSLPIAEAVDADLSVSAEQILIGALRIGKATISATATNGKAALDIGKAQFYGGTLQARIAAVKVDEMLSASAEVRLAAVPARVALNDLAEIPVLDGTGTAVVDLASQGQNWGEFAQAATGTVTFAVADGSLTGIDIDALAAMASDPLAEPMGPTTSSTSFANMGGTLTIGGGTIETDDLVAEGSGFRIAVNGWGSVLSGLIDAKATLTVAGDGQASEVPLIIGGTWWEPEFALDRERMGRSGEAAPRG